MAEIISPNRRKDIGPASGGHLNPLARKDKAMFRLISFSRIASPSSKRQPKSPLSHEVPLDRKTGLSARATVPLLNHLNGQKNVKAVENHIRTRQTSPLPDIYVLSRFFSLVGQLLNYTPPPTSALAQTMMDLPTGGLPPLFCPALVFALPLRSRIECLFESQALGQVQESTTTTTAPPPPWSPDIEVKTRIKRNGRFVWTELRVTLDTACAYSNLVTFEVVKNLGIDKLMPLFPAEENPAQTPGGFEFVALGAVNLTWRGISGGQIRNCLRNFEMRFLVIDVEHTGFEILIGRDSLWECRILEAPMLAIGLKRDERKIPVLPRPVGGKKIVDKKGWEDRKEAGRKLKMILDAEAKNTAEAEAEASENRVGDIGNDHDDGNVVSNKRKIPSTGFGELPGPASSRSRSWRIRKRATS